MVLRHIVDRDTSALRLHEWRYASGFSDCGICQLVKVPAENDYGSRIDPTDFLNRPLQPGDQLLSLIYRLWRMVEGFQTIPQI